MYSLPALPYALDALEPYISKHELELHYGTHHKTYAVKTSEAFAKHPELPQKPIEEWLAHLDALPEDIRQSVRNVGGGLANHTLYWACMSPRHDMPIPIDLKEAIEETWKSVDNFLAELKQAGLGQFGSGWAWLVKDKHNKLSIVKTANQDRPSADLKPLLAMDVWEHAYAYQTGPNRALYIDNFFHVIDWEKVGERFRE